MGSKAMQKQMNDWADRALIAERREKEYKKMCLEMQTTADGWRKRMLDAEADLKRARMTASEWTRQVKGAIDHLRCAARDNQAQAALDHLRELLPDYDYYIHFEITLSDHEEREEMLREEE